jgi:hypothetical protein
MATKRNLRRQFILYLALILVFTGIVVLLPVLAGRLKVPRDDFIAYWASGRLIATGQNPYDPIQLFRLEKATGWAGTAPLMVWYPPWALPLMAPLGWLPYAAGRLSWLLVSLVVLLGSAIWLWRIYDGPRGLSWLALAAAGSFAPAMFALAEGQVIPLVLLGMVGFLHFQKHRKWIPAGLCVAVTAIKPQLLALFWLALLLWSIRQRRPQVILAALSVLAVSTLLVLLPNPALLHQYVVTVLEYPPDGWNTATFGALLRSIFGYERTWLQYAALTLGVGWLLAYCRKHREDWDWTRQLPPILFACVITATFAWMHDETILLVAVVQAFVLLSRVKTGRGVWAMAGLYLSLNIVALALIGRWRFEQTLYIWLSWALLLWYVGVDRLGRRSIQDTSSACQG